MSRLPIAPVLFLALIAVHAFAGFEAGPDMSSARHGHTATLMSDGRVLIAGGRSVGHPMYLDTAEVYDPAVGTCIELPAHMTTPRAFHTATLLPNGKVLIAGGYDGMSPFATAELFDPSDGTFTPTSVTMNAARMEHTATLLPNGTVLLASSTSAELYNVTTDTFTPLASSMNVTRQSHTATLLPTGKVLIAGGSSTSDRAELYDPSFQTFTLITAHMTMPRTRHTATALPNRQVLIAGGDSGLTLTDTAEVYSIDTGTFTATANAMSCTRADPSATLLPNGAVLLVGGRTSSDLLHGRSATADLYNPSTRTFALAAGMMSEYRDSQTATLLPGAKVLLAGGSTDDLDAVAAVDLYNPATETIIATNGNMSAGRRQHTATLLSDGKILIAGGADGVMIHSSAELYDGQTRTFSAIDCPMTAERYAHTATLLGNGKVLLAGGAGNSTYWATAELFDRETATFASTGPMSMFRTGHTATLLANGTVFIAGGYSPFGYTNTAEIYDPASGTFTRTTGVMGAGRSGHTATLLRDGRVLIAGGQIVGGPTSLAELYDPSSDSFTPTASPMGTARDQHTATLLPDGNVLIAGGYGGVYLDTAEVFHAASDAFTPVVNVMTLRRARPQATLLANGNVLLCGGQNATDGYLDTCERYDPSRQIFSAVEEPMAAGRFMHTSTLTRRGRVLVTGGIGGLKGVANTADLYEPGLGFITPRQPVISSITRPLCQPGHLSLGGSLFTGDSEASNGRTNASATNAPLLRLLRVDNRALQFALPQSFSASTFFTREIAHLPSGPYRAAIVSNGIPSFDEVVDVETAPVLATYDAASVSLDGSTVVMPSFLAAGYDGSLYPQTATATDFTGVLHVDGSTGHVLVSHAAPVGTYSVAIDSSNACGSASTSFTLNVIGPPAAIEATSGTPQKAVINHAFSLPLEATVTDSAGHPLDNVAVTFTVPASGATATLSGGGTAYTNASGIASVTATANGILGDYEATAIVGAFSTTFALTNGPAIPTNVVATATSTTSVSITWTATAGVTYEVQRLTAHQGATIGTSTSGSLPDDTAGESTSYMYRVRAIAPSSSPWSIADLATTVMFDECTTIDAEDITKLRLAVTAISALAETPPPVFCDDPVDPRITLVRRAHIVELRDALDAARNALKVSAVVYTRPVITAGKTVVAACDITDLRHGVE